MLPPESSGGYIAYTESTHQMHCLLSTSSLAQCKMFTLAYPLTHKTIRSYYECILINNISPKKTILLLGLVKASRPCRQDHKPSIGKKGAQRGPGSRESLLYRCPEMLQQVIMCNTDRHIVTYDWVDHVDYPCPDFGVARQGRRWNNMLDWVRDPRGSHRPEERPPRSA